MIPKTVVKAVAFGAGSLLGMRAALVEGISAENQKEFLDEMASHIDDLLVVHGCRLNMLKIYDLNSHRSAFTQHKIKIFLQAVYAIYHAKRKELHVIWDHFKDKEITYENFLAIKEQQAAKTFLLMCAECVNYLEQLIGEGDEISTACEQFFSTLVINQEVFDSLLKHAIKMRLQGRPIQGDTPRLNLFELKLTG